MAPTESVFKPISQALTEMIASVQSSGSSLSDFNIGSKLRTVMEAVATVISSQSASADQLQLDSYLDTATGSALDALGQGNWLVARLPGVQATGQVTITRQSTVGAMLLPAGFAQLVAPPSTPASTGVAVLTTQDASFANGSATATVTAQAVQVGAAGDLASGTFLTPSGTVDGISSQNGFEVTTTFTSGVDPESDDAYRTRIPLVVQGRVKGKKVSFQAGALSVPGVLSVAVLGAGQTRGDSTVVPANAIEVYYQGSGGLLAAVQSAVVGAGTTDQQVTAFASANLTAPRGPQRVIANLGVYCLAGTDPVALALAVSTALQGIVNGTGVGQTVYLSKAILAIQQVSGVLSVQMPFTTFCLFGSSSAGDIVVPSDSYASLAAADVTVTVTPLS